MHAENFQFSSSTFSRWMEPKKPLNMFLTDQKSEISLLYASIIFLTYIFHTISHYSIQLVDCKPKKNIFNMKNLQASSDEILLQFLYLLLLLCWYIFCWISITILNLCTYFKFLYYLLPFPQYSIKWKFCNDMHTIRYDNTVWLWAVVSRWWSFIKSQVPLKIARE